MANNFVNIMGKTILLSRSEQKYKVLQSRNLIPQMVA